MFSADWHTANGPTLRSLFVLNYEFKATLCRALSCADKFHMLHNLWTESSTQVLHKCTCWLDHFEICYKNTEWHYSKIAYTLREFAVDICWWSIWLSTWFVASELLTRFRCQNAALPAVLVDGSLCRRWSSLTKARTSCWSLSHC